ncbi:uncharacterized protein LOC135431985 [Drosophila montana]|uniref:uncharacterized protein LOC135431985 n=1 Tax=Drosophila montana TaxID=40370 RepID=UPI00313B41C3
MTASYCEEISSLVISNQMQHSIEDNWIDVNSTVRKIALIRSQFRKINSGAFSSTMFAQVSHMTWLDLKLHEVSSGALLGLYALRKLEIDFRFPNIGLTFLQPVQMSLTHLKINCGINFESSSNIFDNIYLENLIHLDLSHNTFSGPLSQLVFSGTPNVTYLYLKHCSITAIEDDAFQDIAKTLILVDLKHNLLTNINANILAIGNGRLVFDIEPNNWHCNCQLRSLLKFYNENKNLFVSTPYCRMPLNLYGKSFDELEATELGCDAPIKSQSDILLTGDEVTPETDQEKIHDENVKNASIYGPIVQLSCSQAISITSSEQYSDSRIKRDVVIEKDQYFVFEPPAYDLDLELLQNYSVRAYIGGYIQSDNLNIIWFTEELNTYTTIASSASERDYNCMKYEEPYLITDALRQNRTYTFCMMSINVVVISPLFCQPLHIPIARADDETDDIWIAESDKQFTIGMLCLIFFISTIFGAFFAYLGIKSFPHLLEGSKNIMVIKESEKTCCVSTIAESQYNKPSFDKDQMHKSSFGIGDKRPLEASTSIQMPSSCSLKSSSTHFEESFANTEAQPIEYEMPIPFSESRKLGTCLDTPSSPPPLPKRNSKLSLYVDQQFLKFEKP